MWTGGAVICAWLLISRRRLKRHPPSWDQATTAAFRVALGFTIVGLGFAVLFAIWAIQTSGGERILWAIGAGMLAAGGAFFVLFTVAIHRLRSQRRLVRQSYGQGDAPRGCLSPRRCPAEGRWSSGRYVASGFTGVVHVRSREIGVTRFYPSLE